MTGVLTMQVYLYRRLFPRDATYCKVAVCEWFHDLLWDYCHDSGSGSSRLHSSGERFWAAAAVMLTFNKECGYRPCVLQLYHQLADDRQAGV